MLNASILRYYRALRKHWGLRASEALRLARDYWTAQDAGITFSWESERESALDVFGEPCLKGSGCRNPKCAYVHFNPSAENCVLVARYEDPETDLYTPLDSLGMIESPFTYSDFRGYWFMCECEMAGEALASLDKLIGSREESDTEETLP